MGRCWLLLLLLLPPFLPTLDTVGRTAHNSLAQRLPSVQLCGYCGAMSASTAIRQLESELPHLGAAVQRLTLDHFAASLVQYLLTGRVQYMNRAVRRLLGPHRRINSSLHHIATLLSRIVSALRDSPSVPMSSLNRFGAWFDRFLDMVQSLNLLLDRLLNVHRALRLRQ